MKHVLLVLASSFLIACGGSSDNDTTESGSDTVDIINAEVVGERIEGADEVVISPSLNGGRFSVVWEVAANNLYHFEAYISSMAVYDSATAETIFSKNCGTGETFNCDNHGAVNCLFSNANVFICEEGALEETFDATAMLTEIPAYLYLYLEVCDPMFENCTIKKVDLLIQ